MKKKVLFLFAVLTFSVNIMAQNKGVNAVRKFGKDLSEWCRTDDYRLSPIKLCAGDGWDCLVYNDLMFEFARTQHQEVMKEYRANSYIQGFQTEIDKEQGISVKISNIKPATNIQFDEQSLADDKRNSLYYITCDVIVSGSLNYTSSDLFCVRKGSGLISQIGPSGQLVNTSNIMDWDHIAAGEFNSIEAFYGYSKNFPLNIGVAASFSYFNIGLEYGQNFDQEPIIEKQHTNFATSQLNGKYFYLMASPGVFLRYATISYGLGATMAKYHYESTYDSYDENKTFFTMKPKISFNLPLPVDFKSRDEKCYLCPYVGYLFAPKFSKLNSLEFGIGLRFRFDN